MREKKDRGPGCSWACKQGHLANDVGNPVVDFAYYLQDRSNTKSESSKYFPKRFVKRDEHTV